MANYDRLVATLAAIEQHPQHHSQHTWVCGSAMCLAGWAVWLHTSAKLHPYTVAFSNDPQLQASLVRAGRAVDVQAEAEELLECGTHSRCGTHHRHWDECMADPTANGCQLILALFHGENTLDSLYAAVAELCDRDVEVVRKEVAAYSADIAVPDPFDTEEFEAIVDLLDAVRIS